MEKRTLGPWQVSPLGLGCWAIGGPFWAEQEPLGWGDVDDQESTRAIHAGLQAGINFFDTADVYGAGHSEQVLGKALRDVPRDQVVVATKFGNTFDPLSKQVTGQSATPEYIRQAVAASLDRLQMDHLDLIWFHLNDYAAEEAVEVAETLESLVAEGQLTAYGWSTDFPDRAQVFQQYPNCIGFQFEFNVVSPNPMLEFCHQHQVAGVNRGPLAMGLLSGKYHRAEQISPKDIRRASPEWMRYFHDGIPDPTMIKQLNSVRDILTSNGRSLVQGALAWIWASSPWTLPIPGFRTVAQVEELTAAREFGPLSSDQMEEIDRLLSTL